MAFSTQRSSALYERAREVIPGGVNSPVRAMRGIGRDPIFIASGLGAEVIDVDGNRYVDYVCSWGPLILGHAHPEVVRAVERAVEDGLSFGAPTQAEVLFAETVIDRVPGAERVRMTASGTEAAMTAVRLARAYTGRDLVVKFSGAYHGHADGLLAEAGSGMATLGVPASLGVLPAQAEATVVIPWNDAQAARSVVDRFGDRLAAILAEPIPANMGVVPPNPGFLTTLRECADRCGALLIFDEVISGFRVARGGAQEVTGVVGDLTVLGKIVGGGLPAAALAGRSEIMDGLAPDGRTYQAGTLSGNPPAVAAGLATLALLDDEAYATLAQTTETLADGLRQAARRAAVPVQVASVCGLLTVFFSDRPVRNYEDADRCDRGAYGVFCRSLLGLGVYPPPSQFEAWFPSLAHGPREVEHTVETASKAFEAVAGHLEDARS